MTRKTAFAPVVDSNTRVLILGSLPGDASLAAGQYYAHPRNQFWAIVGSVIHRDLVSLAYPERLTALQQANIGLWDTVASARRTGSLDGAIREVEAASLADLVESLPQLRAIGFNGSTSARIGRRAIAGDGQLALLDLPSTSPAYCAISLAQKQQQWNLLRKYLS